MFDKPLSQITADDLRAYVATEPLEDEALEFKQGLDDKEDSWGVGGKLSVSAKQDVFRALIALANTRGGYLVLGISEADSDGPRASGITPIPNCARLAENLRRAAEAVIEPRVPSLEAVAVPFEEQAGVVIFRVGRSLSAPHRLNMSDGRHRLHAFWRRGWETVPMSMREIQDLTLRIDRGEIDRRERLAERQRQIGELIAARLGWAPSRLKEGVAQAYVFSIFGSPLSPILIEDVYRQTDSHPRLREFQATSGASSAFTLHLARTQAPRRPILRGVEFMSERDGRFDLQQLNERGEFEMVRAGYVHPREGRTDGMVHPGWLLSDLANALAWVDRIRRSATAPNTDFALNVELVVGEDVSLSTYDRHMLIDMGQFSPGAHAFPAYHVGGLEEFPDIVALFARDLMHLVGEDVEARLNIDPAGFAADD